MWIDFRALSLDDNVSNCIQNVSPCIQALFHFQKNVYVCVMLKKLVDNTSEKNSLKSVFADGMYDSNNNFRYLLKKRIKPGIKTTSNFISHDFLLLELGRRIPSWIWSSQAQSVLPIQIWTPSLSDKEDYSVRCLLNRNETTNRMVK